MVHKTWCSIPVPYSFSRSNYPSTQGSCFCSPVEYKTYLPILLWTITNLFIFGRVFSVTSVVSQCSFCKNVMSFLFHFRSRWSFSWWGIPKRMLTSFSAVSGEVQFINGESMPAVYCECEAYFNWCTAALVMRFLPWPISAQSIAFINHGWHRVMIWWI